MAQKILGAQRDFSFGEVDVALKRSDDHPARKAGLRQMRNFRILNAKVIQDRPGRSALFPAPNYSRTEEVTMSPGHIFKLLFGDAGLRIVNSDGHTVISIGQQGNGAGLPWTSASVGSIVFALLGLSIFITFPGMRPQVVSWDGVTADHTGWSVVDYQELTLGGQKRTWFYRISPQNITILPAAQTGAGVNVHASAAIFTNLHVGTRLRFVNRQMLITSYIGPQDVLVTILETLPGHQNLACASDPRSEFSVGDELIGNTSGSKGIVTAISVGGIDVQLISTNATIVRVNYYDQRTVAFQNGETIVGPAGSFVIGNASAIDAPSIGVTFWDEEVMNDYRGYPRSVFVDNYRVGFCDFPAVPGGIGWSAINSPTDLYVGGPTVPNGAIFELTPDKARVLYVVPGPESSEFVFCDHRIYYIKIDASNPLKPGSVGFQLLSGDGAAQVQPRVAQDVIFYVNAGGNSVMSVLAPGTYYRPFSTTNCTEFHGHLFSNIVALAAPNADGTFNERYLYALNSAGGVVCGKYEVNDGKLSAMGWGPWDGAGSVLWIGAANADVLFTTSYFGTTICEALDDARYLDGAVTVNNPAPGMAAGAGQGPLWWFASQAVTLMDQATRPMGTYQIDINGFIVPQNNGGENLATATLVAGQPWTSIIEPFTPTASPGPDAQQRMNMRQISQFAAYVIHSSGLLLASLFSSRITRTSPALGTVVSETRFPAYNQDDDATLPPPRRETVEQIPTIGTSYDPRVALIKDTPGPLQVLELDIEVTL